ncbi:MAG: DUF2939 domain-containing protein [Candidatus Binataceae bacterium]
MIRYALRHFTAILILIALGWWLIFYIPNSPTWSVLRMKQAIDARDGDAAAKYVDFQSVIIAAGHEMIQEQAGSNPLGALVGQAAVAVLSKPAAELLESQAKQKVEDGDKDVQMPAVAVLGSIVLMHRNGDSAFTRFTDRKGRSWEIHFKRESGVWMVSSVKNMREILDRLEKHAQQQLAPGP